MLDPGPHNLEKTRVILTTQGNIALKNVTPNFFTELIKAHENDGSTLISTFSFVQLWGLWEIHPKGDEFVFLISGDTDFTLHDGVQEIGKLHINQPGDYMVIPQSHWHTARHHVICDSRRWHYKCQGTRWFALV